MQFTTIVFLIVTVACAATLANHGYERDLTQLEIMNFASRFHNLIAAGKVEKVVRLSRRVKAIIHHRRLMRCIQLVGSRDVCENKVGFYIWAQLLARKVMAGEIVNVY